MTNQMYRQGDLLLKQAVLPGDARDITPVTGHIVLAKGSVSVHEHLLDTKYARLFSHEDKQYVRLTRAQKLYVSGTPARHAPIELPVGDYEVKLQQEYTPQAWRDVND